MERAIADLSPHELESLITNVIDRRMHVWSTQLLDAIGERQGKDNERQPTITVVRPGHTYEGKQGLTYGEGIFAGNTGAQGICMHLLTIPPGGRAKGHYHEAHETAIYVLSGESAMWYGDGLAEHLTVRAGEFLYIPAGVPHLPYNPSDSEPCTVVLARTDPNEQESIVLVGNDKEWPDHG